MKPNNPLYFELIGENFNKFMSNYDVKQRSILIFNKLLPKDTLNKNAAVLEIGCGTGKISEHLVKITTDLTVNDISDKLCNKLTDRLNVKTLLGSCLNLPAADNTFDLIVSSECVEHTPSPYKAFLEMKRILKPGGRIIITTPNMLWFPVLLMSRLFKIRKFEGTENWTWITKTKKWLKKEGFTEIYFSGCHLFPWQLPFAKKILPCFDKLSNFLYPIMINYGFSAKKGH